MRLTFAGDMAMGTGVGLTLDALATGKPARKGRAIDPGYPFAAVKDRIAAADLAIGNLECVVSDRGAPDGSHRPFRAPSAAIGAVLAAGFDVVSIANNHAMDFGAEALADMRDQLDRGGLPYLGRGARTNRVEAPLVREIRGLKIALLGVYDAPDKVALAMVERARAAADLVIVFAHWGTEDHTEIAPYQRRLGHALIDAGAEVVVGTHAHVIQPEERYHGKLIAYGLGNFVFSGMGFDEAHRTGELLELDLDRGGLRERRAYRVRIDDDGAPRFLDDVPWTPPAVILSAK